MHLKVKYAVVALPIVALLALVFQNCSSSSGGATNTNPNTAQNTCPANFVLVTGNATFGTTDFCISKYEAKQVNGLPESLPANTPWVSLTRDQAKAACTAKGSAYALVDNDHWMTIARDIEATTWNYGGDATIFEDGWSRGVTNNSGTTGLAAGADDNDSCYLATQSANGPAAVCDLSTYDVARRVAKLSNGSLMWDFAGNVSEWINDDLAAGIATKDWVLNIGTGAVKSKFGPAGVYQAGPANPTGNIYMQNFGYISANAAPPFVIMRGGGFSYGRYAGIYTAYFTPVTYQGADIGFRCMFQLAN